MSKLVKYGWFLNSKGGESPTSLMIILQWQPSMLEMDFYINDIFNAKNAIICLPIAIFDWNNLLTPVPYGNAIRRPLHLYCKLYHEILSHPYYNLTLYISITVIASWNIFFLSMLAKTFLHHCIMVRVLHYDLRLEAYVSSGSVLIWIFPMQPLISKVATLWERGLTSGEKCWATKFTF